MGVSSSVVIYALIALHMIISIVCLGLVLLLPADRRGRGSVL